jgi:cytochrome b subunit of formate dehydrogenase
VRSEDELVVECSICHDEIVADYTKSAHGDARSNGDSDAPGCETCHGNVHTLYPATSIESPVAPVNLPRTCGACHSDPEMVAKYGIPVAKPIEAYNASVHARMCAEGDEAATCSSCHGSHALYSAGDPRSTVFHANVPQTCGECHFEITEAYNASVHGKAVAHGAREAPVCTDCHGEHHIISPQESSSPVFATNIPKMTCGRCHADLRLAEKYDIGEGAVPSYEDSYHGLATRAGSVTAANCSSCHGVHDILPSSDPASHVHKDNLATTCGECHPGAGGRYAIGQIHVIPDEPEQAHAVVFWVRQIYLWLIWITIGGMFVHNGLDLWRKTQTPPPRANGGRVRVHLRMFAGFRIAHALMIVSFAVLVYSGFALTYPESWWARPLLTWEDQFSFRGWLHRVAGLVMLGALLFHLVHLMLNRRARACIFKMRPSWHDVTEFRERLTYFFGRRGEPPKCPTLGYPEKMEYIALMWGIVVMALTGFMLWFENSVLRLFPKWFSDVATTIHFYEAVLASLAILVWHFYFVIFDPVVYPLDTAFITGKEHAGRAREREHEDDEMRDARRRQRRARNGKNRKEPPKRPDIAAGTG